MKHRIYSILALALFVLTGCVETEVWNKIDDDKNKVRLSVRTMSGVVSRAADTPSEERIDWIDVFVFNSDADQTLFHKERIDMSSAPISKSGEVSLSKNRDFFVEGTSYNMYVVANASANLSENENIKKWSDLLALVQTDHNLQYSAFVDEEGEPAFAESPSRFLMDGFAFTSTDAPAQMQSFVINDGSEELLLKTTLYRAAAKFVIHIKPGDKVEFQKEIVGKTPQYYINQLPVSTKVLRPVAEDYYQPTTQNTPTTGLNDYTFTWNDDKSLTIIGYGYADDWSKLEYTKQTSMVFNIPMNWDKDKNAENGKEAESADNWYKIPLSKTKKFERNTYYQIDITVNAVGAEEREYALELKDIEYTTQPWVEKGMNIGDYSAAFLTLNTDLVKIYDKNIDTDQLTFTSSSPIKSIVLQDVYMHNADGSFTPAEIIVKEEDGKRIETYGVGDNVSAYYIDKFGQKVQLGTFPNFSIKGKDFEGNILDSNDEEQKKKLLALETNLWNKSGVNKQYIRAEVREGQERALNGNIIIYSPINAVEGDLDLFFDSHFNTIRYLEFVVTNEQGITATFRVEQYPLLYIQNEEGYFSYRDDFVALDGTTAHWHNFKDKYVWSVHIFKYVLYKENNGKWETDNVLRHANLYSLRNSSSTPKEGILMDPSGKRWYLDRPANDPELKGKISSGFVGPIYEENGSRYVKNFSGNAHITFASRVVYKYYVEPGLDVYGNRVDKGKADIIEYKGVGGYDANNKFQYYGYGCPTVLDDGSPAVHSTHKNHRMYHIQVTATSGDYQISYPKMLDDNNQYTTNTNAGHTDESDDNSRLVSPSFMLASQLGVTYYDFEMESDVYKYSSEKLYQRAKEHCQQYVEVHYDDLNNNHRWDEGEPEYHYHDWRLPTKAEIDIMIKYQDNSRAMDRVLAGPYYYCASNDRYTGDDSNTNGDLGKDWWATKDGRTPKYPIVSDEEKGCYIRCVRDVKDKTLPEYPNPENIKIAIDVK